MNSKISTDEKLMMLHGKMNVFIDRLGEAIKMANFLTIRSPAEKLLQDLQLLNEEMTIEVLKLKEGGIS